MERWAMIPNAKARVRRTAAARALVLATLLAWTAGCTDGIGPDTVANSLPGLVVSQPVYAPGTEGSGVASLVGSTTGVVYVSLAPGAVPDGREATIRNQATDLSVTTLVLDGGFDPVAIAASVGDMLVVDITRSGSAGALHGLELVRANRVPVVVRTDPPPRKVDVPLNSVMVVVFSSSIDETTVNTGSIQVWRGTTPVAGTVRFSDNAHIGAEFHPDNLLAGQTAYRLVVTKTIRDVNGGVLAEPVVVEFTTGSDTAPLPRLVLPLEGASIAQNDPATGCTPDPNRGRGFQLSFVWSAGPGVRSSELQVKNVKALYALISASVPDTSYSSTACNAFVIDANLEGWEWKVRVQYADSSWSPWTPPGGFRFLPCRLDEGQPCNAVLPPLPPDSTAVDTTVRVQPSVLTLAPGGTFGLTARAYDAFGNQILGAAFTWLSHDTAIATVSAAGVVTALNVGTTTVTATADGASAAATINVGSAPPRILVDASRDGGGWWYPQWAGQGGFNPDLDHQGKALVDALRATGYQVDELGRPYYITPDLLQRYDIVIRAGVYGGYLPEEITAYQDYVRGGGKLLLLADHMMQFAGPADSLGLSFGLAFAGITRGENLMEVTGGHPITHGVRALGYGVGSGLVSAPASAEILGRLSAGSYLDLNNNQQQDPNEPSAPAVLGVMTYGSGRIVFCGDTNLWEWIPQPLLSNVLAWLTGP